MPKALFWSCLGAVAWCYLGYPLYMALLARLSPRRTRVPTSAESEEMVSVVLAVRNEAGCVERRVGNLLTADYPPERLEVLVVCNGCEDGTEAIARRLASQDGRVRVLRSPASEGKAGAINRGVGAAVGDIVVFADARQTFESGAIRRLVRALADPEVGAASGRLVIDDTPVPSLSGVNAYWRFETSLRLAESHTGSVVGVTGAIYAIRRELFQELPPSLVLDDVYLPMAIALGGHRVVLAPDAVAVDRPARNQRAEYRRRVRTMVGNIQLLRLMPGLLSPVSNPLFLRFVSHKVLRLAVPVLLMIMLAAGCLIREPLYEYLILGQLSFYGLGVVGLLARTPLLSMPAAFVLAHAAVVSAVARPGRGSEAVWH